MGLIKDIIGSALASDEPKNGFRSNGRSRTCSSALSQSQYSQNSYGRDVQGPPRPVISSPNYNNYDNRRSYQQDDGIYSNNSMYNDNPPPYSTHQQGLPQEYDSNEYSNNGYNHNDEYYPREIPNISSSSFFRPLALPQLSYGDGQPFLRGYSNELQQYNISFADFMRTLDAINVAIIPSPENQIFQKGANIAGFFVPGAASIGLMVGQLGVGIGAAVGQSAGVSKVLSKANLEIFVPNGLEICIGKSKDVDNEIGIISSNRNDLGPGVRPEDRIAFYGNHIARLSTVLPPLSGGGRSDPLAMLGQRFSDRDNDKKMRKAQRKMEKGKMDKFDSLEGSLQWVMVRRASPVALDHWQQMLQKSDAALRQGSTYQDRKGNGMA